MATTDESDVTSDQPTSLPTEPDPSVPVPQEAVIAQSPDAAPSKVEPPDATSGSTKPQRIELTPESRLVEVAKYVQRNYWAHYAASTRKIYGNILKYSLIPALGDLPIGKLDEHDLQELISTWQEEAKEQKQDGVALHAVTQNKKGKKKKKVKRSTIEGRISVLKSILKYALTKRLLSTDVLSIAVNAIGKNEFPYQVVVVTAEEEHKLLAAMSRLPLVYRCLFLLLLRTGMRIGEALGLKIEDVDLRARTICIKRSWTLGSIGGTKYDSERTVGISDDLYPVLSDSIDQLHRNQELGWLDPTEYLFPGVSRVKPLCVMSLRQNVWKGLLADAGIPYRRIHDLRHTFATTMLQAKADVTLLSRWLGHKHVGTTIDTYGHLGPKDYLELTTLIGPPHDPRHGERPCPACRRPLTAKQRQALLQGGSTLIALLGGLLLWFI